jgi:hypothetical protein
MYSCNIKTGNSKNRIFLAFVCFRLFLACELVKRRRKNVYIVVRKTHLPVGWHHGDGVAYGKSVFCPAKAA